MSLKDLKEYHYGLCMYKSDMVLIQDAVRQEIERKEAKKRKAPTTAEKFNSK